jgi:hypothetical protein
VEAEMNPKMIVIDGKTYTSVEEMPPDIRQKYEQAMRSLGDANNNQIPDVFETMNIFEDKDKDNVPDVLENLTASHATVNTMKIIVDGKSSMGLRICHLKPARNTNRRWANWMRTEKVSRTLQRE